MGEIINNFFVSFLSGGSLTSLCLVVFIYASLLLAVRFILTDKAEDGTFFLVIANIVVNISYCVAFLPEHYIAITKVVIFCIPYLLAFAIVSYLDFIGKKRGKKDD